MAYLSFSYTFPPVGFSMQPLDSGHHSYISNGFGRKHYYSPYSGIFYGLPCMPYICNLGIIIVTLLILSLPSLFCTAGLHLCSPVVRCGLLVWAWFACSFAGWVLASQWLSGCTIHEEFAILWCEAYNYCKDGCIFMESEIFVALNQ